MKVLHLSDLHVTYDGRDLEDVWLAAGAAIHGERFDFVVITGDLTQRASRDEYRQLASFLRRKIEPLVRARRGDTAASIRSRIILVPGNHDVSWSEPVYDEVSLAHAKAEDLTAWLEATAWSPETTLYRTKQGPLGHTSLFKINEARYPQRFAEVDRFLKTYYRDALRSPHQAFELLQPGATGDWAAHVFPEERIMFLAFNSCYRNDRYWHGARIHRTAIRLAKEYAESVEREHGSEFLRIAVWHHGLDSHRVRPDRLTLENLGSLMAAQVKIGFHGHVHESVSAVYPFIADDFVLVSTGSLGASSPERPDAVGNQFSVVDLHWNRLRVDIYQLASRSDEYERIRQRFLYFGEARSGNTSESVRSWAASLSRRVELSAESGIATITIEVHDLVLRDPIVLASVEHALSTLPDPFVVADGERLEIVIKDHAGRREFYFAGRSSKKRYKQVTWRYKMANALALNRAELALLSDRHVVHPHLPDGGAHEAWGHIVRFDYDRLTLSLVCVDEDGKRVNYLARRGRSAARGRRAGAAAVALDASVEDRAGSQRWERVPAEEQRRELSEASTSGFTLSWESPLAGYRYGVMFRLTEPGEPLAHDHAKSIDAVIATCRDSVVQGAQLRDKLDLCLRTATQVSLDVKDEPGLGEHTVSIGYLWQSAERQLRPCFGHFPPDSWMVGFRAGQGIAGHAFRFDRPAAWHRDEAGDFDVIRMPSRSRIRDYDWILAIPILAGPRGASVGVVGFGATRTETGTSILLAEFARQIARKSWGHQKPAIGRAERVFYDFWWSMNFAFWTALRQVAGSAKLPIGVQRVAQACERKFQP